MVDIGHLQFGTNTGQLLSNDLRVKPFTTAQVPRFTTPSTPLSPILAKIPSVQPLALPTPPTLPQFEAPVRDEGRISSLQQEISAPALSELRGGLQRGLLAGRSRNINVQAIQQGEMLRNFGMGISQIMSASHMTALNQYNVEFGDLMFEAQTNYQAKLDDRSARWLADVKGAFTTYSTSVRDRESALSRLMTAETQKRSQDFAAALAEYNTAAQAVRDANNQARSLQKLRFATELNIATFRAKKQLV